MTARRRTRRPPPRTEVWMQTKENGAALKRKRLRKRLTQRELAWLARCSHTTIYMLEVGKMRTLSDELAGKIADRLDCDVEDLFEERARIVAPGVATVALAVGRTDEARQVSA